MGAAMLTIDQLSGHFPLTLRQRNPRGMLVEYLQYELLDSLFKNSAAASLSFIGGTAIRILHNSDRFSEDLDFDNFGLSFAQFEELLKTACRDMEYKGFLIEYRIVEKGAYHCYIRFPEILHQSGLTPDAGRKILIRIDSEAKERLYEPKKVFLNKFTIYRQILAAPAEILLAQKMMTILYRKREKGRDLYDASFLMGFAVSDFVYIEKILGMDQAEFLRRFDERLGELDLNFLARDVEPFLFASEHQERVTTFRDYWLKK
ncbi:MAG: nucleotidyl transferase AbiEii/AbiGii toxin family protein [Desulfobacterales bacterium]|nr:nucleotidyl transferase AbiEii/AbiGii toxin family protein [Desulfobacterales bacterium]